MIEQKDRVVLTHDMKSLCVADIPWVLSWARMPYSSRIFREDEFENMRQRYHDDIEHAFVNGAFEGMSLDAESKEPVFEQMLDSFKTIDEWGDYFSRIGIEVKIAEPPSFTGRYFLNDASKKIAQESSEIERDVEDWIVQMVLRGSLAVYPRGSQLRYYPRKTDGYYEEAYWDDLNSLLESSTRDIGWRFPKPIKGSEKSFKGDTSASPFPNLPLPQKRDEWLNLMNDMMTTFHKLHGKFPNKDQAWTSVWQNPPEDYGCITGQDDSGKDALLIEADSLNKTNFKRRFDRYNWPPLDK